MEKKHVDISTGLTSIYQLTASKVELIEKVFQVSHNDKNPVWLSERVILAARNRDLDLTIQSVTSVIL